MARKIVIVGAGPAGMNAVDTLRELGADVEITLVCDEIPYTRMVLPYFMAGNVVEDHLKTADPEYLTERGVTWKQARVTSVDAAARSLTLDSGETLAYDDLLVATGARAIKPPIPGADAPDVHNLWTLDDAKAALALIGGKDVVVIGGGFIAFTCLDAVAKHASSMTVVELADRILPRMVDADCARLGEERLRAAGIEVRTGVQVTAIEDVGGRKVVKTASGDIACDVVLTATGIKPNVEFLDGTGVQVDQGILVDDHLRTGVDGIWAAGDCAQGPDLVTGGREVHAIQPTATDHGRVAAANIAGGDAAYPGSVAMNVLEVQGYTLASFGDWAASGEAFTLSNPSRGVYRKLIWDGGRVVGAILAGPTKDVGLVNDLGMVKGLIQSRADLGSWKDHLRDNPLDLRRAYIGAQVAPKLLDRTLIGRASTARGYRYPTDRPQGWPAHDVFVASKPAPAE